MAATQGVVGLNTQLKMSASSPVSYVLIGECKDINLAGVTVEFAEFTHQQSTSGYREYKPTFKNSGDLTVKCNWVGTDTQQQALKTGFEASSLMYFQIVYPNSKTHTFVAYVSNLGYSAPLNGPLELSLTLRITGPIAEV
jgi:predicted secreted protein